MAHPLTGSKLLDHQLALRSVWEAHLGKWDVLVDPFVVVNKGESIEVTTTFGVSDDTSTHPDATKRFKLAKVFERGEDTRALVGLDRLALRYQSESLSFTIGRQALTWGSGFLFNPLDLFSPYAPTTVDREYKTGADLMQLEKLFDAGELQGLYIARRNSVGSSSDVSTTAIKWHALVGDFEYELVLGQHFNQEVAGAMFRYSVFGSLLRADILSTCESDKCVVSGLLNIDRAFTLRRLPIYTFVELFHNGYGEDALTENPISSMLAERVQRGELFTLMRDYVAVGINTAWHPQWSQSVSVIGNLNDHSALFQTFFSYDPGDNARMQFSVIVPTGTKNGEFGQRELGHDLTTGGGIGAFLSVAYYR